MNAANKSRTFQSGYCTPMKDYSDPSSPQQAARFPGKVRDKIAAVAALAALALFASGSVSAVENPKTIIKFWPVVDKVVGGVYTETIQIFNTSGATIGGGTLVIELDPAVVFVSSSPGGTAAGQIVTIATPAISANGSLTVRITERAVSIDQFAVSSASLFVNGERVGFMGAPAVIDLTGAAAGIALGEEVGGAAEEQVAAAALPRTGTDPIAVVYFTIGLLLMSWGALRARPII